MTHDEFMSEPVSVVEWTLRLEKLKGEVEEEWLERSSSQA
jgi:hypothetical protein